MRLRSPYRPRVHPASLLTTVLGLMLFVPLHAPAQDVYVVEWTIQDPQNDLLQEVASRTIDAINFWLTRDNVAAQTVRLDDPLRITVIGRYRPKSGQIEEEIIRIRAGGILIEDDPGLYLSADLIDTLLQRNYYWQEEQIDLVDPSLAPRYYVSGVEGNSYRPGLRRVVEPPELPADFEPMVSVHLPGHWTVFGDIGNHLAELPGFSYGRSRIGVRRVHGGLWGEVPTGFDRGGMFGPAGRSTWGVGGFVSLDWATISASVGLFRSPDATDPSDTVRLATDIVAYGTYSFDEPIVGTMFGSLDVGGILYEAGFRSPTVNQVPTERSDLTVRPMARFRLYPGVGRNDQALRLISLQTSLWSLQVGGTIRILPDLDLQIGGALHGLLGERAPFQPAATLWIKPSIRFEP